MTSREYKYHYKKDGFVSLRWLWDKFTINKRYKITNHRMVTSKRLWNQYTVEALK